jgi:hypothetical protein
MIDDDPSHDPTEVGSPEVTQIRELPHSFGRFRNVRYLKSGGQGRIYVGEDAQGEYGQVAIKVPSDPGAEAMRSFLEEAATASLMDHPNVVRALAWGKVEDDWPYLVMPFFRRGSLADQLEREPKRNWREAVEIGRQIAGALQYICQKKGLVHRDLKPHNILLDDSGRPLVMDFGIASSNVGQAPTSTSGTPPYMSPEQATGGALDARSDVWSIGVILYQMLTGRLPFRGSKLLSDIAHEEPVPPRQIDESIPQELEAIVMKCLAKQKKDRFGSPAELAERLSGLRQRPLPWKALIPACAAVLLVAAAVWLWGGARGDKPANGTPAATVPSATNVSRPDEPLALYWHGFVQGIRDGMNVDVPLRDGATLHSGDQYRLVIVPHAECWLYVMGVDQKGPALLFPHEQIKHSHRVPAGREIQLPDGNNWYTLDDQTGTESLYLIASYEPLPELEALSGQGKASPNAAEKLENFAQAMQTRSSERLKTRGATIEPDQRMATAKLNDGTIAEHLMEASLGAGAVVKRIDFDHQPPAR